MKKNKKEKIEKNATKEVQNFKEEIINYIEHS